MGMGTWTAPPRTAAESHEYPRTPSDTLGHPQTPPQCRESHQDTLGLLRVSPDTFASPRESPKPKRPAPCSPSPTLCLCSLPSPLAGSRACSSTVPSPACPETTPDARAVAPQGLDSARFGGTIRRLRFRCRRRGGGLRSPFSPWPTPRSPPVALCAPPVLSRSPTSLRRPYRAAQVGENYDEERGQDTATPVVALACLGGSADIGVGGSVVRGAGSGRGGSECQRQ